MQLLLHDNFQRQFCYVRLSLTARCNFKCQYCLPNGYQAQEKTNELTIREIHNLVAALVELGVWKIRLTGGEPTLRNDLVPIIHTIKQFKQIKTIAITTNGYRLQQHLNDYIAAGLTHLNLSIDSLDDAQFKAITQVDKLEYLQQALAYALTTKLQQVKINSVLLKHTMAELDNFLAYIAAKPLSLRFIELMQTSDNTEYFQNNYVAAKILQNELQLRGWQEQARQAGAGPALEFTHPNSLASVGIIAPYSKDFCLSCNRLRITNKGELRLCLFGNNNYSLREFLVDSSQKEQLKHAIISNLSYKPHAHQLHYHQTGNIMNLSNVGG